VQIRHDTVSPWHDHLPFGYDLVAEARPKILVELGTHTGASFFCFCQAMAEMNIDGTCYAVDTWEGDKHSGGYDNSVFQSVDNHLRDFYRGIAYLLRMTFDEAVNHFNDASIDLLHIDGLHTYDAVKHDFETWYPKVRAGGLVLLHDIEARWGDCGVWRFWEELQSAHQTFEFRHGFGLGILKKPGGEAASGDLQDLLFNGDGDSRAKLRKFYAHISRYQDALKKVRSIVNKGKSST
jgi:hypothetical protein